MISAKLETKYILRDKAIVASYSFPEYDDSAIERIDEILEDNLLKESGSFKLTIERTKNG